MRIFIATFLLAITALCNHLAFAQNNISISGKVISAADGQPVPYAGISIAKKAIGTISNANGNFLLTMPGGSNADSLYVSCMGFKTQHVALSSVKSGQLFIITLTKTPIQLKEINVVSKNALPIIQKAIAHIPDNYINHPHVTRGFYRMETLKAQEPLQLTEAVFDIYNYGYADKKDNLFKLIKARDEKNQRDFHSLELGQKPTSVFDYDIVKHIDNSRIFDKDGLKHHYFEIKDIVDFKGYKAYEIEFYEKDGIKDVTYRGKVYIDTKTFAFLYFDYAISPASVNYVHFGNLAERMLMKLMNVRIDMKNDHIQINYQKVDDKWVLAGVVNASVLYIKSNLLRYDFNANVNFNYIVTEVDTTQTAPFDNKLGKNENINDHDSNPDEVFWKDYNIMLADFNTDDVFKHIAAINEVLRLKNKFEQRERKLPKDPALRIDSMLAYYHTNGQFNGTALVKYKGQVILSKSYGYADKENKLPANPQTTYRIGSTSKTFTSVIINQLVSEGKLDVHAPVKSYIPWYVHGNVTVEQLLAHQSGIPEYFNNNDYKLELISRSFTLKDVVVKFCSDSLEFKPGSGFEYSNSNFAVLALIAQEISGKPFETLLQERIFTPTQMTNTYFGMCKGVDRHKATGYGEGGVKELIYDAGNTYGAGGISSSADDLLKYHDALQNDKLLPKQAKAEMLKPRVEFKDYNAWYDYGWMTDKSAFAASQKHIITYHPGTDLGFFTMYVRQEDTDSCIILLNNTGDFPRYDMTDIILNVLN